MLKNSKHLPHKHRGVSKINNNWILASMATVGVATGVTINQVTTLAATDDTVPESVDMQQSNDSVDPESTDEQPVKEDSVEDPDTSGTVSDYYDDAQSQVEDSNKKADKTNESLSQLQALLNDQNLTSQENWQAALQNALDEYKNNATEFNGTTDETQRLINLYQEKINNTIKDAPNAVKEVTDNETTGTKLEDYQQLTDDFEANISQQLQIVQTNLNNYAASDLVNQTGKTLTDAADALNSGIIDSTKTSDDIAELKTNYDEAVEAYNTAVSAYNDKSGETMETIDSIPDIEEILSDLKIKEAYNAANDKYNDVQSNVDEYNNAVANWEEAVNDYNKALNDLEVSNKSDDETLNSAQQEVNDAIDELKQNQKNYTDFFSNEDNQKIISDCVNFSKNYPDEYKELEDMKSDYLSEKKDLKEYEDYLQELKNEGAEESDIAYAENNVVASKEKFKIAEDNLNIAQQAVDDILNPLKQKYDELLEEKEEAIQLYASSLSDFQDKLASWQTAYDEYINAIDHNWQFSDLEKEVTTSQDNLKETLEAISESQTAYETALDNYQEVLDENKPTEKAVDGELPDLSTLQTNLINELNQNNDLIDTIQAESQLQQRINQINNIISAINSDQNILKEIYNISNQVNDWQTMKDILKGIGDSLSSKVRDYQLAINGNDDTLSYAELVENPKIADINAYPKVDDVKSQYDKFSADFTEFKTNLDKLLNSLIPTDSSSAIDGMKDNTKLSTTGQDTISYYEEGEVTINIYRYIGDKIDYFMGKTTRDIRPDKISTNSISILLGVDGNILPNSDNPDNDDEGGFYCEVSPEKRNEIKEMLDSILVPTYEKEGIQYHLTGVSILSMKPDTVVANVQDLNDIYIFTSLNPTQEVMDIFTGVSANYSENATFSFFYTASPQTDEEDAIDLFNTETLPELEAVSGGDLGSGSLTSTGVDFTVPAPNEQNSGSSTTGEYLGGESIDNAFNALNIKQAPKITLNNIKEASGSIDDSETSDPDTPETPDPEDPETPDITDPENPDTPDPETPNTNDTDKPEITDSDESKQVDNVNIPSTGNGVVSYEVVYNPQTGRIYDSTTKISRNYQNDSIEKLPQMGQENKGIWALLGSILLAISSFSFINLKKKD